MCDEGIQYSPSFFEAFFRRGEFFKSFFTGAFVFLTTWRVDYPYMDETKHSGKKEHMLREIAEEIAYLAASFHRKGSGFLY